jgi:hypothetical protein
VLIPKLPWAQVAERRMKPAFVVNLLDEAGKVFCDVLEAFISPDDGHVTAAAPSDCGSDVAEQTRLMHRGRLAARQQLFDEIRALFEGPIN